MQTHGLDFMGLPPKAAGYKKYIPNVWHSECIFYAA
jgi:hypothetical protein